MHHRVLTRIGVDRITHSEEEMGRHIAQMLHNPLTRHYVTRWAVQTPIDLSDTSLLAEHRRRMEADEQVRGGGASGHGGGRMRLRYEKLNSELLVKLLYFAAVAFGLTRKY